MTSPYIVDGWAAAEIEPVSACPVCGSSRYTIAFEQVLDLEENVPGTWRFRDCVRCRSLFLDPRPTPVALGKAYATYYTHKPPVSENAVLQDRTYAGRIARGYLTKRYGLPRLGDEITNVADLIWPLRQQLDYFMRHLPQQPGRLLDIGCGSGGFMARAARAGWQVEGVEPDGVAAEVAQSAGGVVHGDMDGLASGSFDVVTLSHVIEHLHAPAGVLQRVRDLLAPSGVVWIATPNVRGWGRRMYGECWQALEAPRHLAIPSAEGLRQMLQTTGFRSIRFRRRGRGAAKRFAANEARMARGGSLIRGGITAAVIDSAASISAFAGEEIVVVAERG